MTEKELSKILQLHIDKGDCFTSEVRDILLKYKNSGGKKDIAYKIVEEIASKYTDSETLQDRAYDILDIISGWCHSGFRVWE